MKTVNLPLRVPRGLYCWEHTTPYSICENFDNEGGQPVCLMNIGDLKNGELGVHKPKECLALKGNCGGHKPKPKEN